MQHSAVEWLHEYGRRYPKAWSFYATWLAKPPMQWPDWCWCPMAAAVDVWVLHNYGRKLDHDEVGPIAALAAWRATQGIYRLHPTLLAELLDTPITGDVPADTLCRLPEWCVYVEARLRFDSNMQIRGFFAHMEHDKDTGRAELRLVLDTLEYGLHAHAVHLGGTLMDGVKSAFEASMADWRERGIPAATSRKARAKAEAEVTAGMQKLLSILLYLCADDAEIADRRPLPPKVVLGAKRPIMPAAKAAVLHETGVRLGSALDAARERATHEMGSGAGVTPHVRRAHWHVYWTGPRAGERVAKVRWLAPILVGFEGVPEEATVRPVGEAWGMEGVRAPQAAHADAIGRSEG